jgi:hypothetical protein
MLAKNVLLIMGCLLTIALLVYAFITGSDSIREALITGVFTLVAAVILTRTQNPKER